MKASSAAIELIKRYESLSLVPYLCPAGKLTIGWGHVIRSGETFEKVTKAEAEKILKKDVAIAETAVNELVRVDLHQEHFDALVSFVFNAGARNFKNSTMLRKLNAGDYLGAGREFQKWVYSNHRKLNGLVERRSEEEEMFLSLPWRS